jgi:hypothetical protein
MTGPVLKLGAAGAFVLAACLSQSSQAGSAKPRLLMKGVGSWKFVAGGRVRVVHKDRGIMLIDPKNGAIKKAEDAGAPGTEMPAGRRYQVAHEQGKIVILGRGPGAVRKVRQEKGRIAGTYRVNARTLGDVAGAEKAGMTAIWYTGCKRALPEGPCPQPDAEAGSWEQFLELLPQGVI